MHVTLLGTGSPIPYLERAGSSLVVHVDGEPYLVDCGPRTVYELVRNEIDPGLVRDRLFTHHHIDHNASFHHFAIASWTAGRDSLTVYGPSGTDRLLDALYSIYEEDLTYRASVGYDIGGMEDIEWVPVDETFHFERGGLAVTSLPVDHPIETYAYRFENRDGDVLVFSADTGKLDRLAEFATGADVLIHDAHMSPVGEPPDDGFVWERYTRPYSGPAAARLSETHCTPEQAAETAAAADVGTLVLTHLPPYRDVEATYEAAAAVFDGEIHVAADGLTLPVGGPDSNGSS